MRRLVLIVACIAALGVGAAVWISGAGATVTHKPPTPHLLQVSARTVTVPPRVTQRLQRMLTRTPRSGQLLPRTLTVPLPSSGTCYVGLGSCSEHPCVEFVSPNAVYRPVAPSVVLSAPASTKCRPAPKAQRVAAAVVSAQSAPVSLGRVTVQPVK